MENQNETNRLADFQLSQVAAPRANAEPLPGALGDAFTATSIMVDGIEVRKIVPGDWIIFKALNSPFYRAQLGDQPEEIKSSDEEDIELIFQFITPIVKVRELLKKGRDHFREEALRAISDSMEPEQIQKVVAAVNEQFKRYFSVRLKYIQDNQSEGKEVVRNFQEQPAQVKQA